MWLYLPRNSKTCLQAYVDSEGPDQNLWLESKGPDDTLRTRKMTWMRGSMTHFRFARPIL